MKCIIKFSEYSEKEMLKTHDLCLWYESYRTIIPRTDDLLDESDTVIIDKQTLSRYSHQFLTLDRVESRCCRVTSDRVPMLSGHIGSGHDIVGSHRIGSRCCRVTSDRVTKKLAHV